MDRRDFMKASAGAFFIASTGRAFGAMAPSSRLRFALLGCREGGRGISVMDSALKVPGVEIAVVCDPDSRAMDFASAWLVGKGLPAPKKEKDFRKILEMKDVDGVISVTPDHFHAYSAIMSMRAGKHVYVEKPCAYCPAELDAIYRAWKETGMVFQQGSQRRSGKAFIDAIAELKAEKPIGELHWGKCWYTTRRAPIGRGKVCAVPDWLDWDLWQSTAPREAFRDNIVHYNWHWFRSWGTGECGNNQVHFSDVARWVLGVDYPELVSSHGGKFWMPKDQDWEWPDSQMVTYNFPGDKFITWECMCCLQVQPYMGFGTGAMIYGDGGAALFAPGGAVVLYDSKGKVMKEWDVTGVPKALQITDTNNRSGAGWHDSTSAHFGNFVDAIRANDPLKANAHAEIAVKSTFLSLVGNVSQLSGETLRLCPETGALLSGGEAAKLWSREYAKGWEVA